MDQNSQNDVLINNSRTAWSTLNFNIYYWVQDAYFIVFYKDVGEFCFWVSVGPTKHANYLLVRGAHAPSVVYSLGLGVKGPRMGLEHI